MNDIQVYLRKLKTMAPRRGGDTRCDAGKVRFVTVDEDAMPGIRPFRILSKGSFSELAHLLVTEAPSINELEPNDTAAEAQTIKIPRTINVERLFPTNAECDCRTATKPFSKR